MRKLFLILFLPLCSILHAQNLVAVEDDNGKYGFKREGEAGWVVKPKYDQVGKFSEGLCSVAKCYGIWRDRKTGEGSVSSSVSGAGPSDSLDMQI